MSQKTTPPSASIGIIGLIEPDATAVGAHSTGWISMSDFQAISAVVMAGALGASATVDAKIEQAKSDAGADAKDLTGAVITQLTKDNGDDNKQAVIEVWGEDLDIKNMYSHVRLTVTVGGANSDLGAIVLGTHPRQGPASDLNLASVAQIVNLNT
ncbi:hypothetical protein [Terasakiella pusilla]|uniref:hypothetical protein n=1 Tax=Terasakiella pusilla TaxID=64973 RepID=UPI003AA91B9E